MTYVACYSRMAVKLAKSDTKFRDCAVLGREADEQRAKF
jgi:hypothetical protein